MMIAKLTGVLEACETDHVVLNVGGIGFAVFVSQHVITRFMREGMMATSISLWTEMIIRQEAISLCGFETAHERQAFRHLLSVQGVGVRVALAILSVLSLEQLALAVAAQDKTLLTQADGVGPKLASRIVLELKGRFEAPLGQHDAGTRSSAPSTSHATHDAVLALTGLGYSRSEAFAAVQTCAQQSAAHLPGGTWPTDELVRQALRSLAKH